MKILSRNQKGFTLVELIVSVGLFAIVVTIALTAYLRLIAIDHQARTTNDLTTNLSYVVDAMARGIRTGTSYRCNGSLNCSSGGSFFSFTDENGNSVVYGLGNSGQNGTIYESYQNGTATAITDPRINIQNLTFYLKGGNTSFSPDGIQPQVIFTIQGTLQADPTSAPTTFTIESGATQRYLDL